MNRFPFFVAVFLVAGISLTASAQNFEPGYVITTQLDTLKGLIDYRNWNKNPEKITFKSPVSDNPVEYGIPDIAGFGVHGENYIKATVRICVSSDKDNELTYSPTPEFAETTAFLMVASSGSKNLYYLRDQLNKLQLYIGNTPGEHELLVNYRYRVTTAAGSAIMTQSFFKERLKQFFSDCPDITKNMKGFTYSENSLIKLFREYYAKCGSEKQNTTFVPERFVFQMGLVAGVTSTKLDFRSELIQDLDRLNFPVSQGVTAGISLNILIPRTQKRFSIYNDLTFSNYKVVDRKEEFSDEQNYTKTTSTLAFGYVKLTNMVRYQIPTGKMGLFFNLGFSQGMMISSTDKFRVERKYYVSAPLITESEVLGDVRKYEQGLLGGMGASFKNYGAELRYEISNGMSGYANLNSTVNRISLLLSYTFK